MTRIPPTRAVAPHRGGPAGPTGTTRYSRRAFLGRSAAAAATLGYLSLTNGLVALAADGSVAPGDTIVQIFLRGGADGLSLLSPQAGARASYQSLRPTIAIPAAGTSGGALPLTRNPGAGGALTTVNFSPGYDGAVGLHPQLQPIYDTVWAAGNLALIPGVGTDEVVTRSHFEAQDLWERGGDTHTVTTGYLDRMLRLQTPRPDALFGAVSTSSSLTASLQGDATDTIAIDDLSKFSLRGYRDPDAATAAFSHLYSGPGLLGQTARQLFTVMEGLATRVPPAPPDGITYPESPFGRDLRDVAALITAGVGVRAATVDLGGWDHHTGHGGPAAGRFRDMATALAAGLRPFTDHLIAAGAWASTVVVVVSEFGRTIGENGNQGTDHGRAGSMMVLGGGVQGGVYGRKPYYATIADGGEGDLDILTDWRDPLTEILTRRVGISQPGVVFPTFTPADPPLGLARG